MSVYNNKTNHKLLRNTQSHEHLPLLDSNNEAETDFGFIKESNVIVKPNFTHSRLSKSDIGVRRNELEIILGICNDDDEDDDVNSCYTDSGAHEFSQLTNPQAIIHIIKASIGTGVLTLPSAVRHSGWLLGTVAILVLSLVAIYCMRLLLEISAHLRSFYPKFITNLDYEKTVRLCFECASPNLRKFKWMKTVLYVSLCLAEIGFLTSYHLFVSENLKAFIDFYVTDKAYHGQLYLYQIGFYFLFAPLLFIKTLDKLAYFCQVANLLAIVSLCLSLVYCFIDPIPLDQLSAAKFTDSTFLAFGMIMFAFESINLINPIESNLKKRHKILKPCGVLNIATSVVLFFYLVVGFAGYWKFGDNISSSIILSIPLTPWYFMLVKPLYILSIFISYALQGYVMVNIIWKKLRNQFKSGSRAKKAFEIIWRITIPAITTLLAVSIPHLDLFISLIGALTGASITILVPTICHSVMVYSNQHLFYWKFRLILNLILFVLGLMGAIVGTYSSILNIIRAMS